MHARGKSQNPPNLLHGQPALAIRLRGPIFQQLPRRILARRRELSGKLIRDLNHHLHTATIHLARTSPVTHPHHHLP